MGSKGIIPDCDAPKADDGEVRSGPPMVHEVKSVNAPSDSSEAFVFDKGLPESLVGKVRHRVPHLVKRVLECRRQNDRRQNWSAWQHELERQREQDEEDAVED